MQHPRQVRKVRLAVLQRKRNRNLEVAGTNNLDQRLRPGNLRGDLQKRRRLERAKTRHQVGTLAVGRAGQGENRQGRQALRRRLLDIPPEARRGFQQVIVFPGDVNGAVQGFGGQQGRRAVLVAVHFVPAQDDMGGGMIIQPPVNLHLGHKLTARQLFQAGNRYLKCHGFLSPA
jgi:hypothetical protein